MSYSTSFAALLATLVLGTPAEAAEPAERMPELDDALQPILQRLEELVERFRGGPVSPSRSQAFERELQQTTRDLARVATQWTYNHLEAAQASALPPEVQYEGSRYRRLTKKTPQAVSTLFGDIRVWRLGYRGARDVGEPVLFPLCRVLGLVQGATPALVERVAHYQAEGGATQQRTLTRLRQEHGVHWGVKRLRQVVTCVAAAMEEQRAAAQVEQVLHWLAAAQASRGRHKPVLCIGRDGITLGVRLKQGWLYEVASTGTLTIYDRRGRRLGTVYVAVTPEPGQATLTGQLTHVLQEVLRRWQGPLPRLSYVTDAGDNETAYYQKVLRRLRHPRSGERLLWCWVVDYYHASERLWTMAEALFGKGPRSWTWVRKLQKLLLKPGGVGRVLHSAGALRSRLQPKGARRANFQKAYRYLQKRRQHMRYADCRRLGIPIGSGVTEAACKTVYTQRLKLSGMRWRKAGAQTILTLRVILLSGVWQQVYERTLETYSEVQVPTPNASGRAAGTKAA